MRADTSKSSRNLRRDALRNRSSPASTVREVYLAMVQWRLSLSVRVVELTRRPVILR
jgi:hypothetical protein